MRGADGWGQRRSHSALSFTCYEMWALLRLEPQNSWDLELAPHPQLCPLQSVGNSPEPDLGAGQGREGGQCQESGLTQAGLEKQASVPGIR